MRNAIFRQYAKSKRVTFWEICEALNVSEAWMTRRLHKELVQEELEEMKSVVDQIARTR